MTAPATADEPERQPEITAHRFTAYAQAGLEDCLGCGKRGWSIDGVNVVKHEHEHDADDEACSIMRAARERVATWLMGYESAAADVLATTHEPPAITIAAGAWNAAPPVTYEHIVALARTIEDGHRRAHERWAANWRGRLDGATLNQVMRLRHRGELPHACHLVAGPDAMNAIRLRFAIQDRLPDCAIPVGAALRRLDGVDIIIDGSLGDSWELRAGPPRPLDADERGEVIARGTRLA